MGFFLAIFIFMVVFDLRWWWRGHAWLGPMPGGIVWRIAWHLFMLIQFGGLVWILAGRWTGHERPEEFLPRWLAASLFLWHMLVLPTAVAVWLIAAIIAFPSRLWRWTHRSKRASAFEQSAAAPPEPAPAPKPPAKTGPNLVQTAKGFRLVPKTAEETAAETAATAREPMTRRQLLGAAAALTPPIATAALTGIALSQLDHFRVNTMTLPIPALPPALDGLTIAHVTDVHVGRFTGGAVLESVVRQTNAMKADLVLLTGDLINHALADLDAGIAMVKALQRRFALAMCEGNHDLFESREEFERRVKRAGITLLINESTTVKIRGQRVQLLGLRWGRPGTSGRSSAERGDDAIAASMDVLLKQRRDDSFPILLAHHPHAFDPAAAAGIPLTLAGHTHGGQIMLSKNVGFGPQMFRYWSGLYQQGNSSLVVSNGVGNWFPLRVNAPAEIVHITLRAKV